MAVNTAGTTLYVGAYDLAPFGVLLALNLATGAISFPYSTSPPYVVYGAALSPDNTVAYITTYNGQQYYNSYLYAVTLSNNALTTIYHNPTAEFHGVAINPNNTIAYVAAYNQGTSYLYAINIAAGLSGTPVTLYTSSTNIYDVAVNAAGTIVFITVGTQLVAVNATVNGGSKGLGAGSNSLYGVALSPASDTAYVASQSGSLLAINISANTYASLYTSTYLFSGLAVNAAGTTGYVADNSGRVSAAGALYSLNIVGPFSSSAGASSSPVSSSAVSSSLMASSTASSSAASSSVSSSMVSSSVFSSSLLSSSMAASSSSTALVPSSTSTGAAAFADPHFVGFWQQHIDIGGLEGAVYAMLSDAAVSIMTEFVLLHAEAIHCPPRDDSTLCWQQTGTYFGVVGVTTRNGDRLRVEAGDVGVGFSSVTINGLSLYAGMSYGVLADGRGGDNSTDVSHHQHEAGHSSAGDHPSRFLAVRQPHVAPLPRRARRAVRDSSRQPGRLRRLREGGGVVLGVHGRGERRAA